MTLKGSGGGGQATVMGRVTFGTVEPGDVLVSRMTDPSMLDSIMKATAVVTDVGGAFCHAAIVCTELGIPFVVGTREATLLLHHGDYVEVNPVAGTVTVL